MSASTGPGSRGVDPARFVEHYRSPVELAAAVVLRRTAGWQVLSAGVVRDDKIRGEFERSFPDIPDGA